MGSIIVDKYSSPMGHIGSIVVVYLMGIHAGPTLYWCMVSGVYVVGHNPLILTIDPNFLMGHPSRGDPTRWAATIVISIGLLLDPFIGIIT